MSNKLVIDTSKKNAYIVLTFNEKKLYRVLNEQTKVSENLLPEIDKMLNEVGCDISDINYFGVVLGPGSFTGIRVGLATVKAFAYGLNVKLVAKNTFEVLSEEIKTGSMAIKCTNTSCYFAKFFDCKVVDAVVMSNEDLSSLSSEENFFQIEGERCLLQESKIIENYSQILDLYFEKCISRKDFVDAEKVEPYYIQLSQAEIALKNKENNKK